MARLADKIALITGGASVPARLLSRRTLFAVIVSSILVFPVSGRMRARPIRPLTTGKAILATTRLGATAVSIRSIERMSGSSCRLGRFPRARAKMVSVRRRWSSTASFSCRRHKTPSSHWMPAPVVWSGLIPISPPKAAADRASRSDLPPASARFYRVRGPSPYCSRSKTGRETWNVEISDPRQCGCGPGAAPLLVKDKIVLGVSSLDTGHRGYLDAFDARTGKLVWRFWTIPGPGEAGHDTWPEELWSWGRRAPGSSALTIRRSISCIGASAIQDP